MTGKTRTCNGLLEAEDFVEEKSSPDQKLVAAVLASALQDLMRPSRPGRTTHTDPSHHRRMAAAWIKLSSIEPFSFDWCCYQLDIDPEALRLLIYQKRKRWERAPIEERRRMARQGSTFLQAIREA